MITDIRKQMKSSGAQSVLWITLFAVGGGFTLPHLVRMVSSGGPWVLRVNKQKISPEEFAAELIAKKELIDSVRAEYGQYADIYLQYMGLSNDPQRLATEDFVRQCIIKQLGDEIGVSVNEGTVQASLKDVDFIKQELTPLGIAPFFLNQNVDQRQLASYLKQRGMTMSMLESKIEQIVRNSITMGLIYGTYPSAHYELAYTSRLANAQKTYSIAVLKDAAFRDALSGEITDEELEKFFSDKNQREGRYAVPEKRTGNKWRFSPATYGIAISDEAINDYYNKHKTHLFIEKPTEIVVRACVLEREGAIGGVTEIQRVVTDIITEARNNPKSFSDLIERHSVDTLSKNNGGLLDPIRKGLYKDKAVERAAFLLKNDGDISNPIPVDGKVYIIQRVSKKMPTYQPLDAVTDSIDETLTKIEFKKRFAQDMRALIEREKESPGSLGEYAATKGAHKDTFTDMTNDESRLATEIFKAKKGAGTFFVDQDEGVIAVVTDIQKRYIPSFDAVKEEVRGDLVAEKVQHLRKQRVEEIARVNGESAFDAAVEANKGDRVEFTSSDDEKAIAALAGEENGASLKRTADRLEVVGGRLVVHGSDQSFIVTLDSLVDKADSAVKNEVDSSLNQQDYRRKISYVEAFVASHYRHATIEVNESLQTYEENPL